jgi:hypothetical protein
MKELVFTNFKSLLNAIHLITKEDIEKAKQLLQTIGKGIDSINDIYINNNNELFDFLPNGKLVRVNLYIASEVTSDDIDIRNITSDDIQYKYHIYNCGILSNMFNTNRKHQYKINNREDGTFYFALTNREGKILRTNKNQKIDICTPCLKKLFNQNETPTIEEVKSFQLEKFYQQDSRFFKNINISDLEKGDYNKKTKYLEFWDRVSTQIKINKNYSCEKCGYYPRFNKDKKYIHVHHINERDNNAQIDYMQVLCIRCHSKIDIFHEKIKKQINYKEFMLNNEY